METSKLNENKVKKYISEGKRFDGRALDEFREIKIETGISKHAEGSAKVRLGKTEVIVGVKMDVAAPFPDTPNKGNLVTNAELSPMSSPDFESGPPKFPSIELGRVIDRGIRESKFIDFEKLCIKEGEKVWNVFIDIYSVNDDGNILDAAGIGALAALKATMMPKYDEETGKANYKEHEGKLPLSKDYTPVSLTVYKVGNTFLVDPTKEEQDACDMRLTTSGWKDTIFAMQKGQSGTVPHEEMGKLFDMAEKVREKVLAKVEKHF